MEIRKIYRTSKGAFWSKDQALKKENRSKITESDFESVSEEWVLLRRGHTSVTFFKLTELDVKVSV